jgi:hypothetical protein
VLLNVCKGTFPILELALTEVAFLSEYAVDARYDLKFAPELPEAEFALKAAEDTRRQVLRILPPEAHPGEQRTP